MRRTERIVVFALTALATVWLVVGIVTKPAGQSWHDWLSGLAVGLTGAIAASLLTFLLIDLILARQREAVSHETHEEERRHDLLASLRRGGLEHNRDVVEQMRSAGWLRNGFLQGADFTASNLEGIDFDSADLRGALFVGAKLRRASFRYADVSRARFSHADLRGARFDRAKTDGTDFGMVTTDDDTVIT